MKKCFVIAILCLIFAFPLAFFGCKDKQERTNSYVLDCRYDDESKTLNCSQKVEYVNNSENKLDQICFHLYPNAFRQGAKAKVVSTSARLRAYYNGDSYGNITINSVEQSQQISGYQIGGEDENILIVNLTDGIFPDESVQIEMSFTVCLPNISHRFGYEESTINFGNFYPIACVYEDGIGFIQDLYHSNGDPFYSDCANYQVDITYPSKFTLASTGEQKSTQDLPENYKKTSIKAEKVRDFAFVLSDKFQVLTESVDGIMVNYYFYDDSDANLSLQTAASAMKTFNELFGKYPYSTVSVVQANFVHGGMEYPNMVLVSDDIKNHQDIDYVIAHELAHQWWYGVVGNNEYTNAWVDEGLTEYSAYLFFEQNGEYGLNYDEMIKNTTTNYKTFVNVYTKYSGSDKTFDTSMNRRLDQFETEPEYTNLTYLKGTLMFDSLRQSLGDKKFFKCLKNYYKEYAYKNSSAERLIESFVKTSGVDLEGFFESWLDGSVIIM